MGSIRTIFMRLILSPEELNSFFSLNFISFACFTILTNMNTLYQ